jgi:hypothetical protein
MNRLSSLYFCATLVMSAALVSCSSSGGGSGGGTGGGSGGASGGASGGTSGSLSLSDLVPKDNEVKDWTVDVDHNKSGDANPTSANACGDCSKTNSSAIACLIDGAANPYCLSSYTPKLFLWQNYVNETLSSVPNGATLSLYAIQYPSAEQASGIYSAVLTTSEYSRKQGTSDDWQPTSPVLGTNSRIQDTGSQWWINFYKDTYYIEIVVDPSTGPAPDYAAGNVDTKNEALRFAKAIADKF